MSSQRSVSMTGFFGADPGPSPFDSLLAQFFGNAFPGRRPHAVGITRLMSEQALALVSAAVRQVAEWGNRTPPTCCGRRPEFPEAGS
jgi:ATP-dependent Clp protease ATP-binding subunit ClpC